MPKSEVYNCDCMAFMQGLKDNAFDLCIADTPYGIGEDGLMQRAYFKNRDKDTLVECKRLESEIDREIDRVHLILKAKDTLGKANLL